MPAILTVSDDGTLALPEEIQVRMNLHGGDRLRVIAQSSERLTLQLDRSEATAQAMERSQGLVEGVSLPADLESNPLLLRGFLRDAEFDANAYLTADRAWELAREEWTHGSDPKR